MSDQAEQAEEVVAQEDERRRAPWYLWGFDWVLVRVLGWRLQPLLRAAYLDGAHDAIFSPVPESELPWWAGQFQLGQLVPLNGVSFRVARVSHVGLQLVQVGVVGKLAKLVEREQVRKPRKEARRRRAMERQEAREESRRLRLVEAEEGGDNGNGNEAS